MDTEDRIRDQSQAKRAVGTTDTGLNLKAVVMTRHNFPIKSYIVTFLFSFERLFPNYQEIEWKERAIET